MVHGESKRGRVIGLALVLVALLVSDVAANPILDPLRDFLVRTASRFVSRWLPGSLEVGGWRGSLLSSPVLLDVRLRDAQGEVLAQIKEIRLHYDLKSLLRKRLDIHTVEIVRPQLTLAQDPDGQLTISKVFSSAATEEPDQPETPDTPAGGLPFALEINNLSIRDGQMTVRLPSLPGVREVEGLQAQLSARLDQDGWRVQVQQVTARAQPADVGIQTLQGAVQALGGVMQVDSVRLHLGETQLTADGVLPGSAQPASFRLHLQPLALTDIGRLLHNDALQGQMRLTLQAAGPPEAVQINGQLLAEQGHVDVQGQVNTVATPPHYQARLDVTNLNIGTLIQRHAWQSDLNMRLGIDGAGLSLQELRGHLQLTVHPSHLGAIALHPSQVELDLQQQRLQVQHFDLHTSVAQLMASGALDLAGDSELQYALTADLSGLQQLLNLEALAGNVRLQGQAHGTWPALSAHGTLTAQELRYQAHRLATLRLTYDGRQLGDQPQVTAQLVAEQAQLGTLPVQHITLDTTYQDAAPHIRFAATVDQATFSGGLARGTLTLDTDAQRLVLETLQVRLPDRTWQAAAPLQVTFTPQGLQLQDIRLVHADEAIELTGAVAGEQLHNMRLQATRIDLSYLRRLLSLPDLVSGRATLQVQLSGTLPEPHLQGQLTLQPGAEQRLPFQQFHTTLAYDQRRLQSTVEVQQAQRPVLTLDLQLPVDLALTGLPLAQRLVPAPVDIRLHVQQPDLATVQRWLPALPALTGTLQGTVTLQGAYDHLGLDASLQLQRLGITGSAEHIQAPVHLTGDIVTAASMTELMQAIQQGQVRPQVQNLQLRVPTLQAQLPPQGAPTSLLRVQDLLLQAAVQWTAQGLHATVPRLSLQASGPGIPPTDVRLAARWAPQRLDLTSLRLRMAASEVQGQGYLTLPAQQVELRLHMPRLQLDSLPLAWPAELPAVVQGQLTVRGSVPAPQVEARLQYAGGQIQADLAAQLQEPLPRYRATLRLEGLELQQLLAAAQGRLQANVQLQGQGFSEDERQASVELSAATQGLNLAPDVTARLQASLSGEALRLQQFRLRSAPAELTASGTLSAARQVALQYELRLADVSTLQPYLGVSLQGRGGLRGQVQGPLEALQTRAVLQIEAWRLADLQGQRLQANFAASQLPAAPEATLTAQLVDLQGPSLPPSAMRLEGSYAAQRGAFTVAVTAGPYEQTRLVGNVELGDGQRLTLNTLRLQRQDLVWENTAPVEIVRRPQGELHVRQLILQRGEQGIRLQGTLLPEGLIQAEMQIQQLHLRPTVQAFMPEVDIPDGRLALVLTLGGTLQQPQLQGDVKLTAVQWHEQDLGEILAGVELHQATVRTDLRWQRQGRQQLQARGTLGASPAGELDMHIQAPGISLDLLEPLSAAVTESAGMLQLDLRLIGTLQQPEVRGSLRLQDGVVALAATGERYRDIQARIAFAGNRIDIERLQAGSRSGPLQVTGQITLAGLSLQRVDVSIQAQEFTAMHTPSTEAIVSAAVEVEGSGQELQATGSVTIPRARLLFQELPGGSGPQKVEPWELTIPGVYGPGPTAMHTPGGAPPAAPGSVMPLPFLRLDLLVDMPRNVWIQGPGTAVELRGELHLTQERQEPLILSGDIATVRGFASFFGKKFDLESGQVTFTGSPEINPLLDVTATREVSDYVVTVQVTDRARQPTITLSSTPELPQADIVSLLLIGKTTDRLTSAERTSLGSQAQQIAGDVIAGQLEKALGQSLGLDTIEVTAGDQLGTGSVKVGRYVTQDIFLSFERELGGEDANTAGIEYNLSRRLKLQGTSSDQGETSLDVFWHLDY
jgi:autotransporter translocation and assembly factor TamB